jgi:pyrroloquinoline-quinone synthase
MMPEAWSREEFLARLHEVGTHSYHHLHPFHLRMNAGNLDRDSVRLWVANRFYYQRNIPIKDAAILANCPLREVRRKWIQRIIDHDGKEGHEGGIEQWIRLGIACGLSREVMMDERHVRPGVRFAVDAYVNFARTQPWPVAIASSLTELFAPDLMAKRLDAFQKHYTWIASQGLDYFRARLSQAREDSEFALVVTLDYCIDLKMQDAAIHALGFKCDVLWSMLDAIMVPGKGAAHEFGCSE